jgi:tetratricopeptide (TPR) repeat protein
VEHCLKQGYRAVGWHCSADNVGSWKTAEKVGFERNREYVYYYYVYNPVDHLAELGWYFFKRGELSKTVAYHEQVFSQREDNPDYYYHLAAVAWAGLGNSEKALEYLAAAANRGWAHSDWTAQVEEFAILKDRSEWDTILARVRQNASEG